MIAEIWQEICKKSTILSFIKETIRLKNSYFYLSSCIIAGFLWACSQQSTAPASVAYHNLTAKYNAYLQARDKFSEAERLVFLNRKDNPSEMLPILLPLDSVANQVSLVLIADCIRKASLVAERHQNSKWVDDAYLLIGKSRMLKADFANAIETFKYINTESTNDEMRHIALVNLLRTYTEKQDFQAALQVAEYLSEETLNKNNTREFYIAKAYLHQKQHEYATAVAIMEQAFLMMKRGEQVARLHFATGQMYEQLGKTEKASWHYTAVDKNNPPYELGFFANLNRLLTQKSGNNSQTFDKLLKDSKNKDLKDRIYVAKAQIDLSKGMEKEAIEALNNAIKTAQPNGEQRAYSYLKLANLHFGKQQFSEAKCYYDSALVASMGRFKNEKEIREKKQALDEYVQLTSTIAVEDSLQVLATMNPTALDKLLDKAIADEQFRQEKALERAKMEISRAELATQKNLIPMASVGNEISMFYFYNSAAVAQGKMDFQQRWGGRKLEDNWRRSAKETSNMVFESSKKATENEVNTSSKTTTMETVLAKNKAQKEKLLKTVPLTPDALASSTKRQESSYFELGKLYKLKLNKNQEAIKAFETLLTKFPTTNYQPETLYLLCLLTEKTPAYESWKNKLLNKQADSYYARLLIKNSMGKAEGSDAAAAKMYADAFEQYAFGNYTQSHLLLEQGMKQYPINNIEDKYAFLRILLLGKIKSKQEYQNALNQFIVHYPQNIVLIEKAIAMLDASQNDKLKGN